MTLTPGAGPILLELDEPTWKDFLDGFESWLDNLVTVEASFRQLAEDTVEKITEPHIKEYLAEIVETAKRHEQAVDDLYRVIGRDPAKARTLAGTLMGKARQALGDVLGLLGGAAGNWRDLHQLLLANTNSLGAWAIAEQLGLALGMPEVVDIVFPIVREKSTQHLLIQEYVLEMAPVSILYKKSV